MNDQRVISAASDLKSEHGENPEYDRALVELTATILGLPIADNREAVIELLGIVTPSQYVQPPWPEGEGMTVMQAVMAETLPIVESGYVTEVNRPKREAESYLNAIDLALLDARDALADEHEGKLTEAVNHMRVITVALAALVKGW